MTVKDVLEMDCFKEGYLRAGKNGLSKEVSSITIMDIPDITGWLSEGQLLISGILFSQCCTIAFINSLVEKNIPGIITKEKFTTTVDSAIFEYCNSIGFPVLIAPAGSNWGEITNPVIKSIVEAPYRIIEESHIFHDTLMKSMIEGHSLKDLCCQFYHSSNLTLAITDNDYHLLGYSDNIDWKELTRKLSRYTIQYSGFSYGSLDDKKSYSYTYQNMLLSSLNLKLFIYPVTLNHIHYGNILLAIHQDVTAPDPIDIMKIQQLGFIVALFSTKQNEINNAAHRFNNLILSQLLQKETISLPEAETSLAVIGKKIHRNYYMVRFHYDKKYNLETMISHNYNINKLDAVLEGTVPDYDHILLFERSSSHIILLPDSLNDFEKRVLMLRDLFAQVLGIQKIYIGISNVIPVNKLYEGYQQAKYASNYIETLKTSKPFYYYKDLGILKYFIDSSGQLDKNLLESLTHRYLTPLIQHDCKFGTELVHTLEVYFKNNFSKTTTEKELFIHKNTLRARLNTINKILDCNIDSSDDLFNIQLALKIRYFMSMGE